MKSQVAAKAAFRYSQPIAVLPAMRQLEQPPNSLGGRKRRSGRFSYTRVALDTAEPLPRAIRFFEKITGTRKTKVFGLPLI